ncbi:triple tyrosine motif-containing protein [Christiangramia sabulilitoris]|uniref:Helix-turn-helix domain-containing protein n=1 Tax=Christiangramia sabulilitoris TaxID=2583991 RepID=A0A550I7Z8_9FLAO|nr:triple tyrosine motif-containing protein [Christiangramia sabulilitoris]TRO67104.1 helix-turn-helix domain-containing protein [Christiangramia sabulilitoris]
MRHFRFRILFSFVILLGVTGKITGQNAISVQRIKAIEPFIKAEEVHIQQNHENDLWITTPIKVVRYNSIELKDYNKFRGIPREVGKEYFSTYTDSKNRIWLSGEQGIAVFNSKKDEFEFVSGMTGRVYAMKEDAGNQLWIAAENGIFKLKIDSDKPNFGISRFLSENTMASDIAIFQNKVIFGGPNGILTIDRRSGKFNKIDMGYYQDLPITSIQPLDNSILLGTANSGLFQLNGDFRNLQKVNSIPFAFSKAEITGLEVFEDEILVSTKGSGLLRLNKDLTLIHDDTNYPESLYSIHLNRENLLWMVAREGLFLSNYSGHAVRKLLHDPAKYSSLVDNFVMSTATDANGKVWFGTGKGLSIWNPDTDRWQYLKNLNYQRNMSRPDEITDLASAGEHMWVATAHDGVYKINVNSLLRAQYSIDALNKIRIQSASSIFIDAKKNVWVGGEDGYITRISPNNQIRNYPIKEVQAIAELGPRKIIVATKSRIHSLDPYSGRITDLEKLTARDSMLYYGINDLKITHQGLGLIATKGAGLILYDFEKNEVEVLDMSDGLPSNNISGIGINAEEGYWLSTDKGLAFYEPSIRDLKVFTEFNGLTSGEITTGFARLPDGSLVLGSTKGVNVFKPKTMLAQQEFKPRLHFNSLILPKEKGENARIDLGKKKEIKLDENSGFMISFSGQSHLDPGSILYSWKLDGFDGTWSKPGPVNSANYANLSPGNYTFMVKAKLADAAWSEPETLKIAVADVGGTISSVYLFMGIGILAMTGIFVFVFIKRSKTADLAAKAELREQLQKEFRQPVESAVKSLSKISAEAEQGNTEDLQRYAARFDDLFNQILNFNYQGSVYEISRINMPAHLPKVLKDIEPVYKMKDLEVIVNDQWGETEFFYNMEMLDKVILSLISGSAGYSFKKGKLIINLIETSVGDLKLQITDNGRGIPENDIKVLEKKRSFTSSPRLRDKSGLRYVLKAKDLILNAGGSFSYETEKNEGSTFTAVLKNKKEEYRKVPQRAAAILKAENKSNGNVEAQEKVSDISENKILVIEGETETRDFLVNQVGKYCQIYQAGSAEEGLEKAGMIFPDIIICATILPDMNAFQLSKMMKRNIGLNHINIFLVADEDQSINEMQLDEMTEVIRKPIDVNHLLGRITEILKWQKELRNSYVQSYKDQSELKFRTETDKKFILSLNDIIIQNIKHENFSVHDLSAAQGITSNTLFMKLKSLVNLSPQDFMEFTRLNYARDLMEHTDMNVMEIAYKSGFSSPKIFYSSFKKFYGYSLTDAVEKKS